MNKWRIAGVAVLAALAALSIVRSCVREEPPAPVDSTQVREKFHAARPLRILVKGDAATTAWLNRELRNLLLRGRMRLAAEESQKTAFALEVEPPHGSQAQATVTLLAPDGVAERSLYLQTNTENRLATIQEFARQLPLFLQAAQGGADWTTFPGTQDAAAYEDFLLSADELFAGAGAGFTQPPEELPPLTVDRLEALARAQPTFARAGALLSLAYLSLGGKDQASLTQIATSTAQRALALDPALADAQSALGLASLRRGEWVTAKEHFDAALALDANTLPALEGSAALLMNVGRAAAALPIARRAVALQKSNVGANTSLAYAEFSTGQKTAADADNAIAEVAHVKALVAILSGDMEGAQLVLSNAPKSSTGSATAQWVEPLLHAAAKQRKTSDALQAITLAANARAIDPETEILTGAALRQSDFVFNRMLRMHKQNQSIPLRIFWLPQTDFLRRHARFEQIVNAEGLLPFWQEHGAPDVCASEPSLYGCKQRASPGAAKPK
jgi:tetratricopeptide (TPR) repeat protein